MPQSGANKPLELEAKKYAAIFKGPEHDVLDRFFGAAQAYSADIVMRITGDCPLISPPLCGSVLAALTRKRVDYASNIEPRTFPKGLDCEAFTFEALTKAHKLCVDREHVTTWMRKHVKRTNVANNWPIDGRLCLDTEDDYKVICAAFGHEPYSSLRAA